MSNTFEFAERFGFSPPNFINDSDRKGFYIGITNFRKLFKFIESGVKNNGETLLFDYKDFISTSVLTVSAREQQAMFATKDHLTFRDKEYPVNIPYETENSSGSRISLEPLRKLNKKIGIINTTPDFAIDFNYRKEKASWVLRYYYNNTNTVAIQLECPFFDQFETILKLSGYSISDANIEEEIVKRFKSAFNVSSDKDHIDWLYEIAPNFIIISRGTKQLLIDLSTILTGWVNEIGVNEEKVVIKILNALMVIYLSEYQGTNYIGKGADKLLKTLITVKVDEETLFERIYYKMNDAGFGEKNFTKAIKFLYNIWLFSSWSNDINYKNETNLTNIAYANDKVLGFYDNDYHFSFKNENNGLRIKGYKSEDHGSGRNQITITKEIGNYHPFEPLHLAELPEKGEFKIDDTVIPAFYLKAFDDKAAWKNFEKGTWLALDIITTFSGVGNVLKFRHLTKLSNIAKATGVVSKGIKTTRYIKLAVGFVEIASGAINSLITLSNCEEGKNSKICKSVQRYLFLLEVLSIAGELRTALKGGLKKYATEIIAQSDEAIKKAHPEVIKHLHEISETLRISKTGTGGSFKYLKEVTSLKISGQEQPMSCAAACVLQLTKDAGIATYKGEKLTEEIVRRIAKTDGFGTGTDIDNIGPALREILNGKKIDAGSLSIPNVNNMKEAATILSEVTKKPWIATLKPPGKLRHTIIVDKIENGKVFVRDPWSIGKGFGDINGVEAIISLDDFEYFWKGSRYSYARIVN